MFHQIAYPVARFVEGSAHQQTITIIIIIIVLGVLLSSKYINLKEILSFCVRVSVVLNVKVKFTKDVQHVTSKEGIGNAVVWCCFVVFSLFHPNG